MTNEPNDDEAGLRETVTIPVAEERATVTAQERVTGRVRVVTETGTTEQVIDTALERTDVQVTRVPVDRFLEPGTPMPQTRSEGSRTIVPVIEEVLVIEKRLKLVEEVHIETRKSVEDVAVPVSLRKQTAVVERLPNTSPELETED